MDSSFQKKEKLFAIKLALAIGLVLTAIKFTAYFLTHSEAILTDALESIVNLVAGVFALFSIHYAAKSRDVDHPYGHGKIEYISAGFEGGLILMAGFLILFQATKNLIVGHQVQNIDWGLILTAIAGITFFILGKYLITRGEKLHSLSIVAEGKHFLTDSYSSLGLIIGLGLLQLTGFHWMDSILAIGYSGFIIFTGFKLLVRAFDGLMDKIDFEIVEEIVNVLNENRNKNWIDIHNMRIQKFGSQLHVDCHVTLPWYNNLEQTHHQMENIATLLNTHFENRVEFFIHPEPCLPAACGLCQIENCTARKFVFQHKLQWTLENILANKSHKANN